MLKIDDLNRSAIQPVIQELLIMNPAHQFSLEQIHDHILGHFKIDLGKTTPTQRTRFSERMRRTLQHLANLNLVIKHRVVVALNNGYRTKYQYHKREIWIS